MKILSNGKKAILASMIIAVFAVGIPASARAESTGYALDDAGHFVATNPTTKTVLIAPFEVVGGFFSALLARDQNY